MKTRVYVNFLSDSGKLKATATKILDLDRDLLPEKGDAFDLGIGVRGEWPVVCQRDCHPMRGEDGPKWTIHAKASLPMVSSLQQQGWLTNPV